MDSGCGSWLLHHAGFPIRTPPDQRLLTAPRGISLFATSFVGSWRQGILRALFVAYPFAPVLYFPFHSFCSRLVDTNLSQSRKSLQVQNTRVVLLKTVKDVAPLPMQRKLRLFRYPVFKEQWCFDGGPKRDRTVDLLLARQALSQLSYGPSKVCGAHFLRKPDR